MKPDSFKKGNIKDKSGKVLGVHDGIINFTIGQRRGIKIAAEEPLYVVDINPELNEIIVGTRKDLIKRHISLRDIIFFVKKVFENEILVKIRSTGKRLSQNLYLKKMMLN